MAEPISLASGLIALATFALQSSRSLYQAVESFKSNRKSIRELREELEALDGILRSLNDAVATSGADLTGLKLPLIRCGKTCKDFEAVIVKCTAHSGGPRTSFRDWAKLMYMGNDVVGFKNMLAGYKSTISIALGNANFRKATVTVDVLQQYKELIANTTSDLEEHLQEIDKKLRNHNIQGPRTTSENAAEQAQIQEERDSTEQCLSICAKVSEHINQIQPKAFDNAQTVLDTPQAIIAALGADVSAKRVTGTALKECNGRLAHTTAQLQEHLQNINKTLKTFSREASMTSEHANEQCRIQEEKRSVEQCLGICAEATEQAEQERTNVVEDVSAAQDSYQVVVATLGDLISTRRVTAGARSAQWLGQMSDLTVQQLSRDRGLFRKEEPWDSQSRTDGDFEDRHGAGHMLTPNKHNRMS